LRKIPLVATTNPRSGEASRDKSATSRHELPQKLQRSIDDGLWVR